MRTRLARALRRAANRLDPQPGPLTVNEWNHVITVTGPQGVTTYVNGVPIAKSPAGIGEWTVESWWPAARLRAVKNEEESA